MKHFFNKLLCMHPRFVLCFFFAMSGNPLVACEGFENSLNTETTELCFSEPSNLLLYQGEDINNDFDALAESKKKLLLAGFALENLNEDKLVIDKTKKERTMLVRTNDSLEVNSNVCGVGKFKERIFFRIFVGSLVDPKEVALYNSSKKLLLYGFLSTGGKAFYIPEDILQTLTLFLHDERIRDRVEFLENNLNVCINKANESIIHRSDLKRKQKIDYRKNIAILGYFSCSAVVFLGVTVGGIIMLCEERRGWDLTIFGGSMGVILSLGSLIYHFRCE